MRKFISWNIDSLNAALTSDSPRAQLSRDVLNTLKEEDADFIAIQETKLPPGGPARKHTKALEEYFPGYQAEWVSSVPPARKGYAGVMILYKEGLKIEKTAPEIGAPDTMDKEGRLLVLESDAFYFANVYTPNAGDGLKRLGDRQVWDKCYADYLADLDQKKPVIACGDFNVAHKEIDLAHPESNHMSPGFTDEEREGFTQPAGQRLCRYIPLYPRGCEGCLFLVGPAGQDQQDQQLGMEDRLFPGQRPHQGSGQTVRDDRLRPPPGPCADPAGN